MKNNDPISGSIFKGVTTRRGKHEYEEGNPEVVEIILQGYTCSHLIVIDLKTARELDLQLRKLLPPLYEEI